MIIDCSSCPVCSRQNTLMQLQGFAVLQLLLALKKRMNLSIAGKEAFSRAAAFVGPTGQLSGCKQIQCRCK